MAENLKKLEHKIIKKLDFNDEDFEEKLAILKEEVANEKH